MKHADCRAAACLAVVMFCIGMPAAADPEPDKADAAGEADRPGRWERLWNSEYVRDLYVGVQTNISQSPYIGGDLRVLPLPRPDRLEDYVFNDDWFSIRERLAWWRVLDSPDTPLEFTFVGLYDSRGYNASNNDQLTGLRDRDFTLAGGIGAAWRGKGAYVEAWGVTDWLSRHDGQTYAVSLGFPRKFYDDRLEVVPHVDVIRDSDKVVDYYYGVRADETAPGRPRFQGEASNTLRLVTRGSYRFSRCWALSGRVTVDFLDDAVTDSPIVDRSLMWSGSISFLRRLRCDRDAAEESKLD